MSLAILRIESPPNPVDFGGEGELTTASVLRGGIFRSVCGVEDNDSLALSRPESSESIVSKLSRQRCNNTCSSGRRNSRSIGKGTVDVDLRTVSDEFSDVIVVLIPVVREIRQST